MQIAGRMFEDARVLQAAHAYEQSTDWHKRRPSI
jgi:aspartyl-tRNA(Asn)/glutamyl-tRNA(Gln) amidotransferase subunit A